MKNQKLLPLITAGIIFSMHLLPQLAQAQQMLSGRVFSAKDSTALHGVSVYFDGTSLGTVTTKEGGFKIERNKSANIPLVFSFLGFETVSKEVSEHTSELPPLFLKEKQEMLQEVVVEPDTWSREKKLQLFRKEFLGNSPAAAESYIKNEEAIRLYYQPSKKKLLAEAVAPIVIINRNLGYKVSFDLSVFEIQFLNDPGAIRSQRLVLYEGTSFFEELRKKPRKKHLKNRELSYSGSALHFMRSLSQRKLKENRFRIFHERFETEPYRFFDLRQTQQGMEVKILAEQLSILYHDLEQSAIQSEGEFLIDELGNHTPPMAVIFGGEIAQNRVADMLPLDYTSEKNN